jgi:predicted DNA-binding transcriptional regulator YafY
VRRQARLFAITEYLRGRRTGVTAEALAERFGVTVRTIYRDLDTLRDGSLPVQAERGRGGGYALDRSYALPPVNFTAREAAVLASLGKHAVEMRMLPVPETLERALDHMGKLRFVGVPALAPPLAVRRAVETAWFEGGVLSVRYRNSHGELERRRVRLAGATMERTMIVLLGHDAETEEPVPLRFDRIEQAGVET